LLPVAPSGGDHFGGLGHVTAEFADVLFGEDRLQRASTRKPWLMGEVEQVGAEQVAHFVVNQRLLDVGAGATEDVAGPLRRGGHDDRRHEPSRGQHEPGHRSTRVAQYLEPSVEGPGRPDLLPIGQRVPRRQRQPNNVGLRDRLDHVANSSIAEGQWLIEDPAAQAGRLE
jgi:hypothetical protein